MNRLRLEFGGKNIRRVVAMIAVVLICHFASLVALAFMGAVGGASVYLWRRLGVLA